MSTSCPLPMTRGAAEEVYSTSAYQYDNARRGDRDCLVLQLTLAGRAFLISPEGHFHVPQGWAMLFTHREPTVYGYPARDTIPYRLRFIAMSPEPDLRVMFDRIRTDFGRVVRMPDGSGAVTMFRDVFERTVNSTFHDRIEEAELLYRLLLAVYRTQVAEVRQHSPVEYGYHLILDRFRQPINLKEVAAQCGVSREHFTREFHQRYGESPGGLLRRLRLEHARTLLASTRMAIEDLAVASGFTGGSTFARAFRQNFGKSPGQTRVK